MSSFTSFSMPGIEEGERKSINYYIEINERLKIINDRMQSIEGNFKQLSESSTHMNTILPPLLVFLKSNLILENSK